MKSVVAEALRGKKNNKNPVQASSPKLTHNPVNLDFLSQINRPNYQNKNVEKRLSLLGPQKNNSLPNSMIKPTEVPNRSKFSEEPSVSSLRKISLGQGKSEIEATRAQIQSTQDKAQLLGSTKDGTSVWFFPSVHPNLTQMFHRTTSGYSVVAISSKTCYPGQILLLNELLNTYSDLKYHLTWNKAHHQPFTLELYDKNTNRLEKMAKDIYQKLTKQSSKTIETYLLTSPSAWLSKQLGLTKSVETAGIVEGLSYHNSLLLLDHYFKDGNDSSITIQVEENYLLLSGRAKLVSDALVILKKVADRL
jgi:hypothetical protein